MITVADSEADAPQKRAGPFEKSPAALRFISQLSDDARATLRNAAEIPPDELLDGAWNTPSEQWGTRRGKRALRAIERRSDRPKATPPLPAKKATRDKLRAAARENARYRERLERQAENWQAPPIREDATGKQWRDIPTPVWVMAKDLVSCTSSAAWRYHASKVRNKTALGAIRRAALLPYGDGSKTRRTWSDVTARRIAALGLAMLALAKHTHRKGPWEHEVRGIGVSALRWLLAYPIGREPKSSRGRPTYRAERARRPARSTLVGHHRGLRSDPMRGQIGYLRALEHAGFCVSQQHYPNAAPWEVGRDGWQLNRYRVVGDVSTRNARRRPELVELNREGWRSLSEQPIPIRDVEVKAKIAKEKKATLENGPPPPS